MKNIGEIMGNLYNLYCDESCHLPNDGNKIMVLGCIWCPFDEVKRINNEIRAIKAENTILAEMKWGKISEAKKTAYFDLVNYFFDNKSLYFRVLVVDNKDDLNHEIFQQTYDEWYYKIYFDMIKIVLNPRDIYNIYLDIKDTKSKTKLNKLHEILCNNIYDFSRESIRRIQVINSKDVQIMQLVDILIGAMAYSSRNLSGMNAKNEIVELIKERSGYNLNQTTLYKEEKFNIFHLRLSKMKYE